jgi:hypothetical protein
LTAGHTVKAKGFLKGFTKVF